MNWDVLNAGQKVFHHLLVAHFPSVGLSTTHFCKDWLPMIGARQPSGLNY